MRYFGRLAHSGTAAGPIVEPAASRACRGNLRIAPGVILDFRPLAASLALEKIVGRFGGFSSRSSRTASPGGASTAAASRAPAAAASAGCLDSLVVARFSSILVSLVLRLTCRQSRSDLRFRQTLAGQRLVQPEQQQPCRLRAVASSMLEQVSHLGVGQSLQFASTADFAIHLAQTRNRPPHPLGHLVFDVHLTGGRVAAGQPLDQPGRFAISSARRSRSTVPPTPAGVAARASPAARRAFCGAKAERASARARESRSGGDKPRAGSLGPHPTDRAGH